MIWKLLWPLSQHHPSIHVERLRETMNNQPRSGELVSLHVQNTQVRSITVWANPFDPNRFHLNKTRTIPSMSPSHPAYWNIMMIMDVCKYIDYLFQEIKIRKIFKFCCYMCGLKFKSVYFIYKKTMQPWQQGVYFNSNHCTGTLSEDHRIDAWGQEPIRH